MALHQRTHPNLDVPNCFGCKVAGLTVVIPYYMSSRSRNPGGMSGVDENHAMRKDMEKVLRADKEGRYQKA